MNATATDLANDSKRIIDLVLFRHQTINVQRHGKSVAQIRRKVGIPAKEFAKRLEQVRFTAAESRELKSAMDAANEAFAK